MEICKEENYKERLMKIRWEVKIGGRCSPYGGVGVRCSTGRETASKQASKEGRKEGRKDLRGRVGDGDQNEKGKGEEGREKKENEEDEARRLEEGRGTGTSEVWLEINAIETGLDNELIIRRPRDDYQIKYEVLTVHFWFFMETDRVFIYAIK
ncbi:LOW QUALITY PROTEIN: hypothetical protein V1477_012240 [Vespula maculifrons]|uniref:Uncharacterized protein n=1 Tax=Vespula maculifrons TaxID=7453 RepID=A0ABD2BX11_VESMC